MDNDAIVEQIVRSLSFEVIAVPQDIVQVNSTSKSTPLNVKIRVRKKNDAGWRHGVLSMPKVERKEKVPERIRLVSSDQTILSFNVVMEADFDKEPPKHQTQNLKMATPGLSVQDEKDNSWFKKTHTSPILTKRNKDIFGKCKPGGCLDPPFGEERYSYQPTHKNQLIPTKDDTTKLRTSSIFKNKLFKRKKTQEELYTNETKTSTEADTILSLYEKGSLQSPKTYSNSIITYPHPSNSTDMHIQEVNNKMRYSSEDKSRSSVVEDTGSYFIIPKKTKKLSKEFESVKIPQTENLKFTDDTLQPKHKNALRTMPETGDDLKPSQSETDSSKQTLKVPNFIPIPLLPVVKDDKKDPLNKADNNKYEEIDSEQSVSNTTPSIKNEAQAEIKTKAHTKLLKLNDSISLITDDQNETVQKYSSNLKYENIHDDELGAKVNLTILEIKTNEEADISSRETYKIDTVKEDTDIVVMKKVPSNEYIDETTDTLTKNLVSDSQIVKKSSRQGHVTETMLLHKVQDFDNGKSDINIARLSTTSQNVIPITIKDIDMIINDNNSLNVYTEDQENVLDVDAEMKIETKSLLVTARDTPLLNITADVSHPETLEQNGRNVPEIFANERNDKEVQYSTENIQNIWINEKEPLESVPDVITKTTLPVTQEKQLSILQEQISTQKSADNYLHIEDYIEQTDIEILREATPVSESVPKKTNHSTSETKKESVTTVKLFKKFEILRRNECKFDNEKSPEILNNYNINNIISGNDLAKDIFLAENLDEKKNSNSMNSGFFSEISKDSDFLSVHRKQEQSITDHSHSNDIKPDTRDSLEVTAPTLTSFTKDTMTGNVGAESILYKEKLKPSEDSFVPYNAIKPDTRDSLEVTAQTLTSFTKDKMTGNVGAESILYKEKLKPSEASFVPYYQDNELFNTILDRDLAKKDKVEYMPDMQEVTTHRPYLSTDRVEPKLASHQDIDNTIKSTFGVEQYPVDDLPQLVYKTSQPVHVLRHGLVPWKIDIGLQSYTDENGERVIKSFDSENIPERRQNVAVVVVKCSLEGKSNEINIPIDHEYCLNLQIKNNSCQNCTVSDEHDFTTHDLLQRKKKMQLNVTDYDAEDIDYENVNMSEANKHNKVISDDIRDVLITIYEQELVPLQEIIKGLREEIDMLTAYQMKFREKAVQKLSPKKSKSLKMVSGNKKCACIRKL